jgi:hypothetical protein
MASAAAKAAVRTFAARVTLATSGPIVEDGPEEPSQLNTVQAIEPELTEKAVCTFYIFSYPSYPAKVDLCHWCHDHGCLHTCTKCFNRICSAATFGSSGCIRFSTLPAAQFECPSCARKVHGVDVGIHSSSCGPYTHKTLVFIPRIFAASGTKNPLAGSGHRSHPHLCSQSLLL